MTRVRHSPYQLALSLPVGYEWLCIFTFLGLLILTALLAYRKSHGGQLPPMGFPVLPPTDGPGRFRVAGVNRDTRQDVVWSCDADSAANAKVKAELQGIIVTDVRRE